MALPIFTMESVHGPFCIAGVVRISPIRNLTIVTGIVMCQERAADNAVVWQVFGSRIAWVRPKPFLHDISIGICQFLGLVIHCRVIRMGFSELTDTHVSQSNLLLLDPFMSTCETSKCPRVG